MSAKAPPNSGNGWKGNKLCTKIKTDSLLGCVPEAFANESVLVFESAGNTAAWLLNIRHITEFLEKALTLVILILSLKHCAIYATSALIIMFW